MTFKVVSVSARCTPHGVKRDFAIVTDGGEEVARFFSAALADDQAEMWATSLAASLTEYALHCPPSILPTAQQFAAMLRPTEKGQ